MDALLALLAESPPAQWLRFSRWGYAAVNTLHVLGIALLVGAIVPLDLRLLGWRRSLPLAPLARLLQSVALVGLLLAIGAGALLFIIRAEEYAAQPLFLVKLTLIALAVLNALALNFAPGLARASRARLRIAAALSLLLWIAALVAGRLLAFVGA